MTTPDQDPSIAVLRENVTGRFGTWKKGLKVKVTRTPGIRGLTLTRLRWVGSEHCQLANVMVAVPESLVNYAR